MTTIDLNQTDETGEAPLGFEALLQENQALRAYLKRVLEMLEAKVDEPPAPAPAALVMVESEPEPDRIVLSLAVDHPFPGDFDDSPVRLADLERGLSRIEETVQTLLWLLTESDEPAISAVN